MMGYVGFNLEGLPSSILDRSMTFLIIDQISEFNLEVGVPPTSVGATPKRMVN